MVMTRPRTFLGAVGRFRFGPVISKVYAPLLSTTSAEIHLLGLPDISQLRSIPRWGMRLELGTGKKNKHARSVIITTADRRDVHNKVATNILFVIVFFFWTATSPPLMMMGFFPALRIRLSYVFDLLFGGWSCF